MDSKVNRRDFLAKTGGGMAAAWLAGATAHASGSKGTDRPPNFIVILADDMGAKELSCYGNKVHHTPNLDRLAETGVKFETCFASPICHPTRLMIMTGQYGCHNGVYNFAGRRGGPEPNSPVEDIAKSHVTFANLLKKAGYATALAGKWQLSGEQPNLIRECDFDEYCMWAYERDLPSGVTHAGAYENDRKPSRYWHPSIVKNGEYIPTTPDDYGPDIHADFVNDFIRRNKDRPFFVYYTMCLTHGPHVPTPRSLKPGMDKFKNDKANFKDGVEYADLLIGRLVAALDEQGLRENTVIFFTTDNGTGGEGKGDPTELGARVPMIVNAPGLVKTRGTTMELTDLSDVMPTMMELAGVKLPQDRIIDGKSYARFLRGKTDRTREWIFSFIGDARILRTKRFLLEDNSPHRFGRLYDCGDSRDGSGYKDVTDSTEAAALEARKHFTALLEKLPAPIISGEGHPKDKKEKPRRPSGRERRRK
ncbi:MAG TPA: sulfatase-like hydrolase/transferase [Candidatus Hydrogenedentes bacterium]|nr:sulfatase-like hydrolase/transferase [Candidatus Hydrogenedentota bacterium]